MAYRALKGNEPIYIEDIMIMNEIAELKEYITPQYDSEGNLIKRKKKKSYKEPPKLTEEQENEIKELQEKYNIDEILSKMKEHRESLGIKD